MNCPIVSFCRGRGCFFKWQFLSFFSIHRRNFPRFRSYEKKPVLYRKKDIIYYIYVYEYTNLTKIEIFVSQKKIYILGNCKQSTWCPVVHWSLFYYWSQANYTEVQLISFWFVSFWWRSSFCKTIHVPLFFSGSTVISCK